MSVTALPVTTNAHRQYILLLNGFAPVKPEPLALLWVDDMLPCMRTVKYSFTLFEAKNVHVHTSTFSMHTSHGEKSMSFTHEPPFYLCLVK
jgi:hypothetical protein